MLSVSVLYLFKTLALKQEASTVSKVDSVNKEIKNASSRLGFSETQGSLNYYSKVLHKIQDSQLCG